MGGVSVSDQTARRDVTATNTAATAADNMSMARGAGNSPKVYVMVSVDPITGKSVEKVVTQEYFETQFGQMAK